MVKELVDHRFDTLEGLQSQLRLYFPSAVLASFVKLRGGYSCTNYKLVLNIEETNIESQKLSKEIPSFPIPESEIYVLKVCHGYSLNDVEDQAVIPYILMNKYKFELCCAPYLLAPSSSSSSPYIFASPMYDDGEPCLLLNFLNGRSVDALVEENLLDLNFALPQIGESLSNLHALKINKDNFLSLTPTKKENEYENENEKDNELIVNNKKLFLRSYLQDGICFLYRHVSSEYLNQILSAASSDDYIAKHPYVSFYEKNLKKLQETIQNCDKLDFSILHGDSFVDNILFHPDEKKIVGFVDYEDSCVGPWIIDLACCLVGNCFTSQNELDSTSFSLLLSSYSLQLSADKLEKIKDLLYETLILCLFLNATWRFSNFNIVYPDKRGSHGEKYHELYLRIQWLQREDIKEKIQSLIKKIVDKNQN